MKIWLFLITTCGLGMLALYSQKPTSPSLSDEALKLTLSDTRMPGSLGSALNAMSRYSSATQLNRNVANSAGASGFSSGELQELTALPSDRQLAFARAYLDRLERDQYPKRLALVVRLDELDRTHSIPGLDEFALSELDSRALNSITAPIHWKRSYGARLMGIYARLHPGPEGKSRIQAKVADQSDPAVARALGEAKNVLDDLTRGDAPLAPSLPLNDHGPESGAAPIPFQADIPITDFTPPPPPPEFSPMDADQPPPQMTMPNIMVQDPPTSDSLQPGTAQ